MKEIFLNIKYFLKNYYFYYFNLNFKFNKAFIALKILKNKGNILKNLYTFFKLINYYYYYLNLIIDLLIYNIFFIQRIKKKL